jgi:biotin operon repressor
MKKDENILESSYEPCPKCNDDPSCPLCGKTHDGEDNHSELKKTDYEEYSDIIKHIDKIILALEHQELSKDEKAELMFDYMICQLELINNSELESLQFMYSGILQFKRNTDKQNEVLRLKLQMKTEEDIAKELGISRRAVRERVELVQKKGYKALTEAKLYTDREELRQKIIDSDKQMSEMFYTIKDLFPADELLKKANQ